MADYRQGSDERVHYWTFAFIKGEKHVVVPRKIFTRDTVLGCWNKPQERNKKDGSSENLLCVGLEFALSDWRSVCRLVHSKARNQLVTLLRHSINTEKEKQTIVKWLSKINQVEC